MMDWDDSGGLGWGGWLLMSLAMLVFWGIIVVAAIAVWRAVRDQETRTAPPNPPEARRLLDERFARGELDPDEYARRRDLLGSGKQ